MIILKRIHFALGSKFVDLRFGNFSSFFRLLELVLKSSILAQVRVCSFFA